MAKIDYTPHIADELADFREYLGTLDEVDWDGETLCEDMRVRDVVAHITLGRAIGLPTTFVKLAGYRFSLERAGKGAAKELADSMSSAELLDLFSQETSVPPKRGIARIAPKAATLADNFTHQEDIRWVRGEERSAPAERLAAVLQACVAMPADQWGTKRRAKGLRLVATDTDWSHGDGPEVRGPGAALTLALGGRPAALDRLDGEGLATLTERVKPSAD